MTFARPQPTGCLLLSLLMLSLFAHAGDGHDHAETPIATETVALPRLAVAGDTFEMVAELSPSQLVLYVDWHTSNAPAAGAQVQLWLDGQPLTVTESAPGIFVAGQLPAQAAAQRDDQLPLVATIQLEQIEERLSGHFEAAHDEQDHPDAHPWAWLTACAVLLLLALLGWRHKRLGGGQ